MKSKTYWKKLNGGDGEAYFKLADCYRDGKCVKKDFVGMLSDKELIQILSGLDVIEVVDTVVCNKIENIRFKYITYECF